MNTRRQEALEHPRVGLPQLAGGAGCIGMACPSISQPCESELHLSGLRLAPKGYKKRQGDLEEKEAGDFQWTPRSGGHP